MFMGKWLAALVIFLLWGSVSWSQLQVNPAVIFTPEELVRNVFLGNGVEVKSVKFTGRPRAFGQFNTGNAQIGLENGIVLSTGVTDSIARPNNSPNTGSVTSGSGIGDPDLARLTTRPLRDVVKLEITFIPFADTLRFRYVFASEEFPEFNCSQFNDVFGFFIAGPGINGPFTNQAQNIALVPDPAFPNGLVFTNIPVTINNVNSTGSNGAECQYNFQQYFNDNSGSPFMMFDGYLDVFTAQAIVQPCQEYTIKLVLADASDTGFDTGVFLEAKSFGAGTVAVTPLSVSLDQTLAEGCSEGGFTIALPTPAKANYPLDYRIIGTATNGIDYLPVATNAFIPSGQTSITLPVKPLLDNLAEGIETIGLDIQTNPCRRDTFYLNLSDNLLLPAAQLPDQVVVCRGDSVLLNGTSLTAIPAPLVFRNNREFDILLIDDNNPPSTTITPTTSPIQVNGVQPTGLYPGMLASVCIDVEHRFIGDVDVYLVAPGGQFVELTTDNGGSGDNYTQTCFSPSASNPINFGGQAPGTAAPFTGTWKPEGTFDYLWDLPTPAPVNGTWKLLIKDDAAGFNGKLLGWNITFNAPYQINYAWTPAGGLACNNCPITNAAPDLSTRYIVTLSDSYGCQVKDSVNVLVVPVPQLTITNRRDATCLGQNDGFIQVSASGGIPPYRFVLTPGNITNSSGTFNNLAPGEYLVTLLTGNDICEVEVPVVINQTQPVRSQLNLLDPVSCSGKTDGVVEALGLGGQMPYSYQWSNGNTSSNFNTMIGEGWQIVTITDALGCKAIDSINIVPTIVLLSQQQIIAPTCFNSRNGAIDVTTTGGLPPYTINWTTGSNANPLTGLDAGQYGFTVTDAAGCLVSNVVTVEGPEPILITAEIQDNLCAGDNNGFIKLNIIGGTSPYNYNWSHSTINSGSVAGLSSGNYNITITDARSCSQTASYSISAPALLNAQLQSIGVNCATSANGNATLIVQGGKWPYAYRWSDGSPVKDSIRNDLSPGAFSVSISDANGCEIVSTGIITSPPAILTMTSAQPVRCHAESNGKAWVAATGGRGGFRYRWNTNALTDTIRNLRSNSYQVTVTDQGGCSMVDAVTVTEPPPLVIQIDSIRGESCQSSGNGYLLVSALGGNGNYQWNWGNGSVIADNLLRTDLEQGIFEITLTDRLGCSLIEAINIPRNSPLEFIPTLNKPTCADALDGGIDLAITGGSAPFQIVWADGNINNPRTNLKADVYAFTVTDSNGCILEDSISLTSPLPLIASLQITNNRCFGEGDGSITVIPQGGTKPYFYQFGSGNFSPLSYQLRLPPGNYPIQVRDNNGCIWSGQGSIAAAVPVEVQTLGDTTIRLGEQIRLVAIPTDISRIDTFWWQTLPELSFVCQGGGMTCPDPTIAPVFQTNVTLFIRDTSGCISLKSFTIKIRKEREVFVPTGFTPGNDGTNDRLAVHSPDALTIPWIRVYDRWGGLLWEAESFEPNQLLNGWDGTYNGKNCDAGPYVWVLLARFEDGLEQIYKGEITLVR